MEIYAWPALLVSHTGIRIDNFLQVQILNRFWSYFSLLTKLQCFKVPYNYRKVASSSLSWLVAHFQIFRRLMKGKFDAYVL